MAVAVGAAALIGDTATAQICLTKAYQQVLQSVGTAVSNVAVAFPYASGLWCIGDS